MRKVYSPVTMDWVPTPSNILGETWFDANFFMNWYPISPGNYNWHTGGDYNNNKPTHNSDKDKPVFACFDGMIVYIGNGGGTWGIIIVIVHTDENNEIFVTRYGHVKPFRDPVTDEIVLKKGDRVVAGQTLALVGDGDPDGRGPKLGVYRNGGHHLHFDISVGDKLLTVPNHWPGKNKHAALANYVDPGKFLINPVVPTIVRMKVNTAILRKRALPNGAVIGRLSYGTVVEIQKIKVDGFYLLNDRSGWLHSDYLTEVA